MAGLELINGNSAETATAAPADPAAPAQRVDMVGPIEITLSSGRPALLFVPSGLTELEGYSLVNAISKVLAQLSAGRRARPRIQPASVLPRSLRRRG